MNKLARLPQHMMKKFSCSYLGTPHGSWKSAVFPYQILFHLPKSGTPGNLQNKSQLSGETTGIDEASLADWEFWKALGAPTLQAVTGLCLLADYIQNRVDELCALCVVTLGPVVTGAGLAKDEVVRTEHLSIWTGPDGVHGTGF